MNSIAINFVDCAIIVLYLIFIIWWGLRNGKSSDAGSYFLAGRTMPCALLHDGRQLLVVADEDELIYRR